MPTFRSESLEVPIYSSNHLPTYPHLQTSSASRWKSYKEWFSLRSLSVIGYGRGVRVIKRFIVGFPKFVTVHQSSDHR